MSELLSGKDAIDKMTLSFERKHQLLKWLTGNPPYTDEETTLAAACIGPNREAAAKRVVAAERKRQTLQAIHDLELRLKLVRYASGDPNATLDP